VLVELSKKYDEYFHRKYIYLIIGSACYH